MTPVKRALSGAALYFDLREQLQTVREQIGASRRSARTLVKDGPLRVTLVGLGIDGELAAHRADGPITVQVLEGSVEFEVAGERRMLEPGALLALEGGVEHAVRSSRGGIFLLTVAHAGADDGERVPASAP